MNYAIMTYLIGKHPSKWEAVSVMVMGAYRFLSSEISLLVIPIKRRCMRIQLWRLKNLCHILLGLNKKQFIVLAIFWKQFIVLAIF